MNASKRVLGAINGNEFALFCQRIAPIRDDESNPAHHEVLIRLREEESGLVPPGAFFSLAEEHGLLPQLDRWVFEHVFQWMVTPVGAQTVLAGEMYFINVAAATLSDPGFPDFVELHLRMTGAPGESVCIEIPEADLVLHQGDAVAFARKVRECGCRVAISGFGHNRLAMGILKLMQVDFLKIDSSIVRQVAAYPVQLGKAVAITRLAKTIGVRTIAEMVEDSLTLGTLLEAGVDYAQGFGIALPKRLEEVVPFTPAPAESSLRCAA
jgi:EAL domain-containing protein (putative c-di-GMP-specific phosphodiesterase class I)